MRSNLDCWKALQEGGYFEQHPLYGGGRLDIGPYDVEKIERFVALRADMMVVVIGCGYGRETAHICKRVARVYGIDVDRTILDKAREHLGGVENFRPVLAERYADEIPAPVDLVYSVAVMQHLTRDMVRDYLATLGGKLSADGRMVIQFLEADVAEDDASTSEVYEPSVSWSRAQTAAACEACGLKAIEIVTEFVRPGCVWHWSLVGRA